MSKLVQPAPLDDSFRGGGVDVHADMRVDFSKVFEQRADS
jgi:hypothetical protein